jgi:xanthine/uracil/vitamin C permease (AzgA family)
VTTYQPADAPVAAPCPAAPYALPCVAGITAFVLGCGFVVAMFFAPIFSSIPGFATGPALVVVGTMMIGHAREIDVSGR